MCLVAGILCQVALARGGFRLAVAFVPGGPFYANEPQVNTLRLSFVTVPPEKIRRGVAILGKLLRESIATGLRASA